MRLDFNVQHQRNEEVVNALGTLVRLGVLTKCVPDQHIHITQTPDVGCECGAVPPRWFRGGSRAAG